MITPVPQGGLCVLSAALLMIGGLALVGCEKKLDPQEYGEVLDKLPKIKGAEKPYPLPKLEEPAQQAKERAKDPAAPQKTPAE